MAAARRRQVGTSLRGYLLEFANLKAQSTEHTPTDLGRGAHLRCGVHAGPLRALRPRARENPPGYPINRREKHAQVRKSQLGT